MPTTTTVINHADAPVKKDMGKAKAQVTKIGAFQAMKICLEPGLVWADDIGTKLPGCPKTCPSTHFGYLESGSMLMKMDDGTEVMVNAGDTYHIPPGHTPIVQGDVPAVMVEFSQDTAAILDKMEK